MTEARRRILPFFIPHRGCPNQCVFCNQHRITGVGEEIDFDCIEKEIFALPPDGDWEVAFYGGSFTGLSRDMQQRLLASALVQKERGLISHIRVSTRPDYIDEERLSFLQQYGVDIIEIGVQSLDDEVLTRAGRGHTYGQTCHAVNQIKKFGFQLIIQLLPGLPVDSYQRAVAGARETASWGINGVRLYPAVVLKDTPLYDMYMHGVYRPLVVEEAVAWCRDMAVFFLLEQIPIIRVGLQPTEEICWGGAVVAGAFHPAFGQLVQSALALEQCKMLLSANDTDCCCIAVPERQLSTYIGQKRINVLSMRDTYDREIQIIPDSTLGEGEIALKKTKGAGEYCSQLSWQGFLRTYGETIAKKLEKEL